MLCERGCLARAKGAWRLRSSLTYPLDLSLCLSLSPSISLPISRSFSLGLYRLSLLRFICLPCSASLPSHSVLLVMLASSLPFHQPNHLRHALRDDVNSHAHVFELPHHARVIWSGSCTRFLTSKANVSCACGGTSDTFTLINDLFIVLKVGYYFKGKYYFSNMIE